MGGKSLVELGNAAHLGSEGLTLPADAKQMLWNAGQMVTSEASIIFYDGKIFYSTSSGLVLPNSAFSVCLVQNNEGLVITPGVVGCPNSSMSWGEQLIGDPKVPKQCLEVSTAGGIQYVAFPLMSPTQQHAECGFFVAKNVSTTAGSAKLILDSRFSFEGPFVRYVGNFWTMGGRKKN